MCAHELNIYTLNDAIFRNGFDFFYIFEYYSGFYQND